MQRPGVSWARADAAELTLAELGGLVRGTLSVQASQAIAISADDAPVARVF